MPKYNVWFPNGKPQPRWTNTVGDRWQGPIPIPLSYAEARKIADEYSCRGITCKEFSGAEVREIAADGTSPGPVALFVREDASKCASSGMKCTGCGDWNDYAAPNCPNGDYKCFSCRRR